MHFVNNFVFIFVSFIFANIGNCLKGEVAYDSRVVIVNGTRKLLMVGHVHYPRATPSQWASIFRSTKEAGINAIDTYVFWNTHEEHRGQWDFEGRRDLRAFIKLAQEYGLMVVLRIGPYVCAEWNYGGLPAWLRDFPGIDFRTDNEPFKREMARFVDYIVNYVSDLLYGNGGPIILLQIENEYGLTESDYGEPGHRYIEWAVQYAKNTTSAVPWFVCQQNNVKDILNTCNGFYCDDWVAGARPFVDQPGMFTENWSGWFGSWGEAKPTRPTEDLAFSTMRFIARGGTYNAYYMWFGGSNFGRDAGYLITTSYDYDAPVDEYGFTAEPKFSHLRRMHEVLFQFESVIVDNRPVHFALNNGTEVHIYGDFGNENSLAFISNYATYGMSVSFRGLLLSLPKWSVTIVRGGQTPEVLFNSAKVKAPKSNLKFTPIDGSSVKQIKKIDEPVGISADRKVIENRSPLEQISVTKDLTDYIWYETDKFVMPPFFAIKLVLEHFDDFVQVFWNGVRVGSARGGNNTVFNINVGPHRSGPLQILTQTLGLTNFGAHRQNWKRGLTGKVILNGVDITSIGWRHQAGLLGEMKQLQFPKIFDSEHAISTLHGNSGFEWVKITVSLPKQSLDLGSAYALDLGKMTKGFAWVNGHSIGRYWNILSKMPEGPTNPFPNPNVPLVEQDAICDYAGPFTADKCRDSRLVGKPTQRYYQVPSDWLNFAGDKESLNEIVLFEELGGADYSSVKFVIVERQITSSSDLKSLIAQIE